MTTKSFVLRPEDEPGRTFTDYHLAHRARAGDQDADSPHFDLPAVGSRYPRSSLPALEAAAWVRETAPGVFDAFDLALFEAFFGRSEDISDPATLGHIAERQGLDPHAIEDVRRTGHARRRVLEEHDEALSRGIHAIPAVLIPGGEPIIGAVLYPELHRAVRAALSR